MSAVEQARAIRAREVSARELTEHYLERIERLNDVVGAFVTLTEELAREQSDAADQRVLRGEEVLLEAEVKVASLRAADFRPCPMDPSLYQELHRLLAGPTP